MRTHSYRYLGGVVYVHVGIYELSGDLVAIYLDDQVCCFPCWLLNVQESSSLCCQDGTKAVQAYRDFTCEDLSSQKKHSTQFWRGRLSYAFTYTLGTRSKEVQIRKYWGIVLQRMVPFQKKYPAVSKLASSIYFSQLRVMYTAIYWLVDDQVSVTQRLNNRSNSKKCLEFSFIHVLKLFAPYSSVRGHPYSEAVTPFSVFRRRSTGKAEYTERNL